MDSLNMFHFFLNTKLTCFMYIERVIGHSHRQDLQTGSAEGYVLAVTCHVGVLVRQQL